jgi:hypothetical protein
VRFQPALTVITAIAIFVIVSLLKGRLDAFEQLLQLLAAG